MMSDPRWKKPYGWHMVKIFSEPTKLQRIENTLNRIINYYHRQYIIRYICKKHLRNFQTFAL
jgi:hypothetical protein